MKQIEGINLAMQMKLAWSFLSDNDELGRFLWYKFVNKKGELIRHYKKSSIWLGIKQGIGEFKDDPKGF